MRLYYWSPFYRCICEDCMRSITLNKLGQVDGDVGPTKAIEIYEGVCELCGE